MSEFFTKTFYGNTVSEWFIALAIVLGSVILAKLIYWFSGKFLKKLTARTETKLDDILIDMLEEPFVFGVIILGIWIGLNTLNIAPWLYDWIYKAYTVLIAVVVAWFLARVLNSLMEEYLKPLTQRTDTDFDDQMYPIVKKGVRAIIWTLGIIVGLNNAGYDVGALIAGLGIGGLALAMAAKDYVSNIFGGFTIITDKPFRIGNRVRIGSYDGYVTEIGIRSFRLRTLSGTIVTIPNSIVTDSMVENVSLEPSRKITLNLGLTYDTPPEKMQLAMEILKEIAESHPHANEGFLLSFNAFGDFSLGILFIYFIKPEGNILQTQTDINIQILKRFNENGLNFAFPTQSLYIEKN